MTTHDPYGGSTWAYNGWQDAHYKGDDVLTFSEALDAAQTWEEVLAVPAGGVGATAYMVRHDDEANRTVVRPATPYRQTAAKGIGTRLPRMMGNGRPKVRTYAPVAERPERGRIVHTIPLASPGTLTRTLAHDGSPINENGRSSRLASAGRKASTSMRRRALLDLAGPATTETVPTASEPIRRPILDNGEVIGWETLTNNDGTIG